jgi:RNase P subunit RPR2
MLSQQQTVPYFKHGLTKAARWSKEKLVLPWEKELRRMLCRSCDQLLIPGRTCRIEFAQHEKLVVYQCSTCQREKRYRLDQPEPSFAGLALGENEVIQVNNK